MGKGCAEPVAYDGYNGTFLYPESGRLGDVVDALVAPLGSALRCGAGVAAVDVSSGTLGLSDGKEIGFDRLVSTMPLPRLLEAMGVRGEENGVLDATRIAHVRVALRGALHTRLHWLYVAEEALDLHRIGFPSNVNPRTCPPGCVSLSLEYTLPPQGRRRTADEIGFMATEYLSALGLLEIEDFVSVSEVVLSPAYVVCRSPGRGFFAEHTEHLARHDVQVAGRFGRWDYLSMEGAFASGLAAVDALAARTPRDA
jgi:protoporphyrinogen oxidase